MRLRGISVSHVVGHLPAKRQFRRRIAVHHQSLRVKGDTVSHCHKMLQRAATRSMRRCRGTPPIRHCRQSTVVSSFDWQQLQHHYHHRASSTLEAKKRDWMTMARRRKYSPTSTRMQYTTTTDDSENHTSGTIIFGSEARAALFRGVCKVADAVRCTLGPSGRCAVIAYSPVTASTTFSDRGSRSGVHQSIHTALGRHVLVHDRDPTLFDDASASTAPRFSKDGVTVARNAIINPPFMMRSIAAGGAVAAESTKQTQHAAFQQMGSRLTVALASRTDGGAGDGTTTSVVLLQALLKEAIPMVEAGIHPVALREGMKVALAEAMECIADYTRPVSSGEDVVRAVMIAANGEVAIANLVADALEHAGRYGLVTVELAQNGGLEHELEAVDGMEIDEGAISASFLQQEERHNGQDRAVGNLAGDQKTRAPELDATRGKSSDAATSIRLHDARILILAEPVTGNDAKGLQNVLQMVVQRLKQPLIVIAPTFDEVALDVLLTYGRAASAANATLLQTTTGDEVGASTECCNRHWVVAVNAPSFGENQRGILQDIGVLTGANLIAQSIIPLSSVTDGDVGQCEQVDVSLKSTCFVGGYGDEESIENMCNGLQSLVDDRDAAAAMDPWMHEQLRQRVSRLSSGSVVIRVGGASIVEQEEIRDRVVDSVNAGRAAMQHGLVPGAGATLVAASERIKQRCRMIRDGTCSRLDNANGIAASDFEAGLRVVQKALLVPSWTIIENCGYNGDHVVAQLQSLCSDGQGSTLSGFDGRRGGIVRNLDADSGIVDPAFVVRSALADAVRMASVMLTTEVLISPLCEIREPGTDALDALRFEAFDGPRSPSSNADREHSLGSGEDYEVY